MSVPVASSASANSHSTQQMVGVGGPESLKKDAPVAEGVIRQALQTQGEAFTFPEQLKGEAAQLTSLNLNRIPVGERALQEIVAHCPNLRTLSLDDNDVITSLQPLAGLPELDELSLLNCTAICDLKPLAACTKLTTFYLRGCPKVTDLQPLSACPLRKLYLTDCTGINDLNPLKADGLHTLYLYSCTGVSNLQPLSAYVRLETLYLSGCTAICDVTALNACHKLRIVELADCPGITAAKRALLQAALPNLSIY